jgi:hypothetical protein
MSAPQLHSAAPWVALLDRLSAEAAQLAVRAPNGDVTQYMRSVVADVKRAMTEAEKIDVFVTIDRLASVVGRPVSTLRRFCLLRGEAAGAAKVHGVWSIHLPTFLACWERGDHIKEVA